MSRGYLRAPYTIVISWSVSLFASCYERVRAFERASSFRGEEKARADDNAAAAARRSRITMSTSSYDMIESDAAPPQQNGFHIQEGHPALLRSRVNPFRRISSHALAVHANIWPPVARLYKIRFPRWNFYVSPECYRRFLWRISVMRLRRDCV